LKLWKRGEVAAFVCDHVIGAGRDLRDDEAAIEQGLDSGGVDQRCGVVFGRVRIAIVVEGTRRLEHNGGEACGRICVGQVDMAGNSGGGWFLSGLLRGGSDGDRDRNHDEDGQGPNTHCEWMLR
jgi:hypothetical protein